MKDKQLCGCVHDGHQWLVLCQRHETEEESLHVQAAQDHELEQALTNNEDWLGAP